MARKVARGNSPASRPRLEIIVVWFASLAVLTACGAAEETGPANDPNEPAAAGGAQPDSREITAYAGTGTPKFKGDGGPATEAGFFAPTSVAVDSDGNVYIGADKRVRKVEAGSGIISTMAGSGSGLGAGNDGPALKVGFQEVQGLTVDAAGNVFVVDSGRGLIRRVDAATGIVTTVAGGGVGNPLVGEYGDDGPATEALVRAPDDVAVDREGNLYIVGDNRVRKVDVLTGNISTVAGTGKRGLSGDGGPAVNADLAEPKSVAADDAGNFFIVDTENHRVRKVDVATGIISTVAGMGKHFERGDTFFLAAASAPEYKSDRVKSEATGFGYSGDRGPAVEALMSIPLGIAIGPQGSLFIAEGGVRVRKVDMATGVITTVVDGGGSTSYETGKIQVHTGALGALVSIAVNNQGDIFLADYKNNVVHKVSSPAAP